MKHFHFEKIIYHFKNTKIFVLFVLIVIFSILYLGLDDSHFSGVNFIKETIKEEVIKKEIEKKIKNVNSVPINDNNILEGFYLTDNTNKVKIDKQLDKATKEIEKNTTEQEITTDKIETPPYQLVFDRVYFSVITSSLLGYGDIYPVSNVCKLITMIQSVLTVSLIIL
tara:strand:+ start:295 stop:798 length:504 start_codon:yes stop_codon:yes gene_type:complete